METTIPLNLLTTNFVKMLSTATQRPVGDGEAPSKYDLDRGYFVVYRIRGGQYFEGLPAEGAEGDVIFQVTSVGRTRSHCDWLMDRARLTVIGRASPGPGFQVEIVPPDGMVVIDRRPESGTPVGPNPEGAPPNQRWSGAERYVLSVSPE